MRRHPAIKLGGFDESTEFFEIGLGLAGEADDHAGSDGHAGDGGANAFEQFQKNIGISAALHPFEHRPAGMLQRHIDVFDQRLVSGNGVKQFLRDFVGIGVEETNPLGQFSGDFGEPRQEFGQTVFETEIFAVTSGVLADQIDFADAHGEHAASLR